MRDGRVDPERPVAKLGDGHAMTDGHAEDRKRRIVFPETGCDLVEPEHRWSESDAAWCQASCSECRSLLAGDFRARLPCIRDRLQAGSYLRGLEVKCRSPS